MKKLFIIISGILILPIKSFAVTCVQEVGKYTYCPLEDGVFDGFVSNAPAGTEGLGLFLNQAFQFGLAVAAALSVIMIVWGGVEIMLSEGPWGKLNGKEKIWNAIWGLGLALVSWLILYIINPDILIFKL